MTRDRERIFTMADNRQAEHERVGSIAGLGAGVIAGAQMGTVFIPIPIIGTFTGALLGGVLGSEIGRNVGAALLDGVSAFTDSLSGHDDDSDGGAPPPGQSAF
jgi:phage tail tape-measure protein